MPCLPANQIKLRWKPCDAPTASRIRDKLDELPSGLVGSVDVGRSAPVRGSNELPAVPNLCQTTFVQSALAGTIERAGKYLRKAQRLDAEGMTGVVGGGGAVGGMLPTRRNPA